MVMISANVEKFGYILLGGGGGVEVGGGGGKHCFGLSEDTLISRTNCPYILGTLHSSSSKHWEDGTSV